MDWHLCLILFGARYSFQFRFSFDGGAIENKPQNENSKVRLDSITWLDFSRKEETE
jgi:hypothetical protein